MLINNIAVNKSCMLEIQIFVDAVEKNLVKEMQYSRNLSRLYCIRYNMNAELISVGTELLMGEILNTDVKFLAEQLSVLGIDVYYQTVVGDNRDRLSNAVKIALGRADIVILSGGLGPTPDDLTKEVVSEALGRKLILDNESLENIKAYFEKSSRNMPESNIKQAMLPKDCIILKNNNGTAPGCVIETENNKVILLPGPPNELIPMFNESVCPYLKDLSNEKIYSHTFKIFGLGESKVAEIFKDMMEKGSNPTLAPYAQTGEVRLRLATKSNDENEAQQTLSKARDEIMSEIGKYVYAEEDVTFAEAVVKKLIQKNITISAAESCTGGMFAKMTVDIPGCSSVLKESFITYSNEAKQKYLGVQKATLEKYGAVSEATAREMAEGVIGNTKSMIGVGITGIAGPDGGTEEKPVGLVYVAVSYKGKTDVRRLLLNGSREKVRYLSCLNAFDMINKMIE